jgi:hypothetical protein
MNDPMVAYHAPQTKKSENIMVLRVTKSLIGDRVVFDMIRILFERPVIFGSRGHIPRGAVPM